MITIWIPGRPVPKGRPRRGKHGGMFTPQRTRDYERDVKTVVRMACNTPLTGPLEVAVCVYFGRPKHPKHGYPSRPDIDNLAKSVLDACNGTLWIDDGQIVRLTITKEYSTEREGVQLEVRFANGSAND